MIKEIVGKILAVGTVLLVIIVIAWGAYNDLKKQSLNNQFCNNLDKVHNWYWNGKYGDKSYCLKKEYDPINNTYIILDIKKVELKD